MARYDPLTRALQTAAARGEDAVEMSFHQIEGIVGKPLPSSAEQRHWWANNSQVQALAWRAAGYHVDQVYLDRRRVRFATGARGGTNADRGRSDATLRPLYRRGPTPGAEAEKTQTGNPVDVRVQLQWLKAGEVTLDGGGKPLFPLEDSPGLYRMTLTGGVVGERSRVYIGETDNLRRRLSGNYRNPGPRQQTSLRINALVREHLVGDHDVALAVATSAVTWLDGEQSRLDLTRKAGRLLAENAALVLAQVKDDADIVNLG